jgi:hypothetical protein
MQQIQDKEFDQFFKNKFEEAEIGPSENLWDNIETQLAVKPKRVFPVYRVVAAIAVAALCIGLLMYTGQHTGEDKAGRTAALGTQRGPVSGSAGTASSATISAAALAGKPEVATSSKSEATSTGKREAALAEAALFSVNTSTRVNKSAATSSAKVVQPAKKVAHLKKDLPGMQPLPLHSLLHQNELKVNQDRLSLPAATTDAVALANNTDYRSAADSESAAVADLLINENTIKSESRGIRNMGDLINYVVDKVDKSDEKIIQFKTDDDSSSLVALNIGIIRFNTRKHK